jgi:hypothetical protein
MLDKENIWLPLKKDSHTGKWLWGENTEEHMFTNWDGKTSPTTSNQCAVMDKIRGMWVPASCNSTHHFICCEKYEVRTPKGSIPRVEMRFTGSEQTQMCNVLNPMLLTEAANFYELESTMQPASCRNSNHPASPPLADVGYTYAGCLQNLPSSIFVGVIKSPRTCALRCRKYEMFAISRVEGVLQCFCRNGMIPYEERKQDMVCNFKISVAECQAAAESVKAAAPVPNNWGDTIPFGCDDSRVGVCKKNMYAGCKSGGTYVRESDCSDSYRRLRSLNLDL